jgi:predicted SAM-dependent methyltransferase
MQKWLLFFFSHRFLAVARWDLYFLGMRVWNTVTFQNHRLRRFLSTRKQPVFLNLGSGPRGLDDDHWVNVDGFYDRNVHFRLDLSRALPFPDASLDGVFCEHVLEHFSLEDGEKLAREIRRILRPGGCFRIVVPDADLVLRRYFDAPEEMVARRAGGNATPIEIVNLYFRQRYEHQFLYDWPTMQMMLLRARYNNVSRTAFGQGKLGPPIILDDQKYAWESLYVEAQK